MKKNIFPSSLIFSPSVTIDDVGGGGGVENTWNELSDSTIVSSSTPVAFWAFLLANPVLSPSVRHLNRSDCRCGVASGDFC